MAAKAQSIADEIAETLRESLISWIVQLNHGLNTQIPEVMLVDIKKATFEDIMSAVDRNIPVSSEALYEDYGLPRPKNDKDIYVKPAGAGGITGLSDLLEGENSLNFQTSKTRLIRSLQK
jgi:hypothetical protein